MSGINKTRIEAITDGDESLKKELLSLFFETYIRCKDVLDNTKDDNDAAWRDAAHELKGAAGTLGFERIEKNCRAVEQMQPMLEVQKEKFLQQLILAIAEVEAFSLPYLHEISDHLRTSNGDNA